MHDVFFFTDIHGARPLFDAIMNYCMEQDPECWVIFGGDACDRGHDGYQIMKELLDHPQVTYLKGNHEDMFTKAAREIKEMFGFQNPEREDVEKTLRTTMMFDYKYSHIQDSIANGGLKTLTDWVMDGMPMDFVKRIENLPLTFSYENRDFCHAAGVYRTFKEAADAEYEGKEVDSYIAESLVWSRTALNIDWEPNRIAVFGHTPTPYLEDYTDFKFPEDCEITPVLYNKKGPGWKLDMDTGAVFTGRAYVLNVLTMQAQGFKLKDNKIEKIEVIKF